MPAGRPSKYDPKFNEQALKLARLGATDVQICDFFGIGEATLNVWKKKHPEFRESLKNGKDLSDAEVADSLYKRACGYRHPAVKIFQFEGRTFEHRYIEFYPPDTTACIFWLKNRQSARWRDKQVLETESEDGQLSELAQALKNSPTEPPPDSGNTD